MIKYFKELDKKTEYYLPLVDIDDNGEKRISTYQLPLSFVEKYADLFKNSDSLIKIFENFKKTDIFEHLIFNQDENMQSAIESIYNIDEELYPIIDDYKKINITPNEIEEYLYIIKKLSNIYVNIFKHNREYYKNFSKLIDRALNELNNYKIIEYTPNRAKYIYQPDAWFITPNNYLYNPGSEGHSGRDFKRILMHVLFKIEDDKEVFMNHKKSQDLFKNSKLIEKQEYITQFDFQSFLNYCYHPVYLEKIDNIIGISRERHIINLILGIINAQGCFYNFIENLCMNTNNPKYELDKIEKWTKHDINDLLVQCCGFHKVSPLENKTISTSCFNYETEFEEYIKRGWKIDFVPPIIIDKHNKCVEQYPKDYVIMRKLLKK